MNLRLSVALAAFALAGCATTQAEKISASDAFGAAKVQPLAKSKPPPPKPHDGPVTADSSAELVAELTRFAATARSERSHSPQGAPMTSMQVKNWIALNGALDTFLARPVEKTSSYDVIRARATAEAELEMDARAYGDMPSDLADEVLRRVNLLAVRMAEVRRQGVLTSRKKTAFSWPIEPVVVTSLFGRRLHPITRTYKLHMGIDLAAEAGQLISAAADGVVLHAGVNGAHGLQVEVQHTGGVTTRYSHLSELLVEPGLLLKKGDPVGLAGTTGMSTGVHLHFEVWRDGRACDPLEELGRPEKDSGPVASLSR